MDILDIKTLNDPSDIVADREYFESMESKIKENPYIETYKLIAEIMGNAQHEVILHKTIEALAHYFNVLPEGVYSSDEQAEFESEIFEVFDDNNF